MTESPIQLTLRRLSGEQPVFTSDEVDDLKALAERIRGLFPSKPSPVPHPDRSEVLRDRPEIVRVVDPNGNLKFHEKSRSYEVDERGALDVFGDDAEALATYAPGFWANAALVKGR